MNLVQRLEETGWHARMDRRFVSGRVLSVDPILHSCTVDVGESDSNGNPVYLSAVPFSPQTPPQAGDHVTLAYGNAGPHSLYVAAGEMGGGTAQSSIQVVGAVSSIQAGLGAALKGAVTLAPGNNVTLTENGQTITIAAAGGGTPAGSVTPVEVSGVVGSSANYAREDHAHSGVHSLAASGQSALTGDVILAAGSGINLAQSGNQVAISSTPAQPSGVASLNGVTGAVTLAAAGPMNITESLQTITLDVSAAGRLSGAVNETNTVNGGQIQIVVFTANMYTYYHYWQLVPITGSAMSLGVYLFLFKNADSANWTVSVANQAAESFDDGSTTKILSPGSSLLIMACANSVRPADNTGKWYVW